MTPVTDPKILAQLNSSDLKPVTDPKILAQLNAPDEKPSWFSQHGRELAQGAGGIAGAVLGAPVAAAAFFPSVGIGSAATEILATGLGTGIGGQTYDLVQNLLGHKQTTTPNQRLVSALKDVEGGSIGALGGQVVGGALKAAAPVWSALKNAGPAAKQAVNDVRSSALAEALKEATQARRAETFSATRGARATQAQQTAQATAEGAKPIDVGQVSHLSEQGAPGQQVAQANAAAADKARKAAFETHEKAIQDVVKANEAKGNYIDDLHETKSLMSEVEDKLNPSPVSAPTTAPRPTSGQIKAYKMVQDALENRTVELTPAQAAEAKSLGHDVQEIKAPSLYGGAPGETTYVRTFKTPLEAVTNLRRYFGDAAYGKSDISGFEGVNASTFKNLYGKLGAIEDAYTAGLSAAQKTAYQTALANAEKFSTGLGEKITATEGSADLSKMPASKVPSAVIGGGADTFKQFQSITNPQTAAKLANDAVEKAFHDPVSNGPTDYDAAVKVSARGTPLGDVIHSIPSLEIKVQQHLNQLLDAKNAGVQAKEFGQTAAAATKAQEAALKTRLNFQSQVVQLKNLPDKDVLPAAEKLFNDLATNGKISPIQQQKYLQQIRDTAKTVGIKEARNKVVKWGLRLVGAGAATEAGMHTARMMGQ